MAKLYDPVIDTGRKAFCGPKSISILTGYPVSHIERLIRVYRLWTEPKPIKGVFAHEVVVVLQCLGCEVTPFEPCKGSLRAFLEDTGHMDTTFLVRVKGHILVAYRGCVTDRDLRPMRRVTHAWKVRAPNV